ncbi:MAG: diacylglycerol kinase family protein, partial [Lacisediminihabitans sp.]
MAEAAKPRRVFVAINPTASFGKGSSVGPAVVAALLTAGHDVTALEEPSYADLVASATAAVATRPDALIVVGGDGMVNLG